MSVVCAGCLLLSGCSIGGEVYEKTPHFSGEQEGQIPADVIGDAYEYMIGEFATMAGKKAGSFFTPQQVSEIMAQIVDPQGK